MKFASSLLLFLFSLSLSAQELSSSMYAFLQKNVKNGLVDYKGIKAAPSEMNALLNQVNRSQKYTGNQEKAFLINAYNLFVIKGVVDNYPVEGPLKIDGFFDKNTFSLRGEKTTLNKLEKETLAKQFPDARLHFALVCAAIGCPKLASFAYTSTELESQLEQQTQAVINDRDFIKVNGPELSISQIFDWYAVDFGGKEKIVPFTQKYHLLKVKFSPKYSFYEYDWKLNAQK
ncbi:MAG: hypothetical protein ACJATE_001967 [Bacteroidia bacterium]|jgi:hypothetical protein